MCFSRVERSLRAHIDQLRQQLQEEHHAHTMAMAEQVFCVSNVLV